MMKKVFHSGNPVMKHIRVGAVFLWRLSLLIAILWGCFYLGYKSAFLLLVGLPWLVWLIIEKLNGQPINHNSARNLLTYPLAWLILFSTPIGILLLVFTADFWPAFIPVFLLLVVGLFVVTKTEFLTSGCYACFKETPFMELKSCPACSLKFEGGGWVGFKKHWELNHQDIESYDTVWKNMCAKHRKKDTPKA